MSLHVFFPFFFEISGPKFLKFFRIGKIVNMSWGELARKIAA
jgi:hypothetical protein